MLYNITGIGGDSVEMVLCYAEMIDYFRTSIPTQFTNVVEHIP